MRTIRIESFIYHKNVMSSDVHVLGRGYIADEAHSATDRERMTPETQVQRSRTGLRFPIGNATSAFTRPTTDAEMKKIKVVLPKEDASISEPPPSRNVLQTSRFCFNYWSLLSLQFVLLFI